MPRLSIVGFVAIAAFAGCGAPQVSTTPFVQQNTRISRDGARARSWMLPEAKSEDLAYVANVYTITAYSYPKGKLVGTLNNFYVPYGECVDAKGDVYITDSRFGKIYEYAHGGTKPIKTLKDPSYQPYGCAVDPTTGDLAVANYSDSSGHQGNVYVYRNAKGFPKSYVGY
jgi:DNA-binding beta-propeller fold protein YncE